MFFRADRSRSVILYSAKVVFIVIERDKNILSPCFTKNFSSAKNIIMGYYVYCLACTDIISEKYLVFNREKSDDKNRRSLLKYILLIILSSSGQV